MHPIRLPVINREPVRARFGARIRTPGIERGEFRLRYLLHFSEHLTRRRLVESGFHPRLPPRLQQPHRARRVDIQGVFCAVKADFDMALGAQIVNLVRLDFQEKSDQRSGICQVAIVEVRGGTVSRLRPNRIQPLAVEGAGSANEPMHFVTFGYQQFGQIRTILARDTCNKRSFRHKRGASFQQQKGIWQANN
jgi:hypothetical protein